ncbi:MAG: hypothetical protein K2W86_02595 [Sphingomonas sp.]|nr:hypothetical protein [Sphingomonas sp.]
MQDLPRRFDLALANQFFAKIKARLRCGWHAPNGVDQSSHGIHWNTYAQFGETLEIGNPGERRLAVKSDRPLDGHARKGKRCRLICDGGANGLVRQRDPFPRQGKNIIRCLVQRPFGIGEASVRVASPALCLGGKRKRIAIAIEISHTAYARQPIDAALRVDQCGCRQGRSGSDRLRSKPRAKFDFRGNQSRGGGEQWRDHWFDFFGNVRRVATAIKPRQQIMEAFYISRYSSQFINAVLGDNDNVFGLRTLPGALFSIDEAADDDVGFTEFFGSGRFGSVTLLRYRERWWHMTLRWH